MIRPNATSPSVSSSSRWYSITSACLRARSRSSRAATTSGGVGRSDSRRETQAAGSLAELDGFRRHRATSRTSARTPRRDARSRGTGRSWRTPATAAPCRPAGAARGRGAHGDARAYRRRVKAAPAASSSPAIAPAASPIRYEHHGAGGNRGRELCKRPALERPAEDQPTPESNAVSALMTASGFVALESSTYCTPEARHRPASGGRAGQSRAAPRRSPHRRRRRKPRQPQPPPARSRGCGRPRMRACSKSMLERSSPPNHSRRPSPGSAAAAQHGIVAVEDGEIVRGLVLEQAQLAPRVLLEVPCRSR